MPLVVPYDGALYLLDRLLHPADYTSDNLILHLYKSDTDIEIDTVLADVTEADYSGYSSVELDNADWSAAVTIAEKATSTWGSGPVFFAADSGSQDVYGWYLTNGDEDVFVLGQRLDSAPFSVTTTEALPLTAILRALSEFIPS